jgi:hypothetical protein
MRRTYICSSEIGRKCVQGDLELGIFVGFFTGVLEIAGKQAFA